MKNVTKRICAGIVALVITGSGMLTAQAPTVNGLFYLDGDDSRYSFLGQNPGRGKLYYYQDGTTLYLAVLVDPANANDNVFADTGGSDDPYLTAVGWTAVGNKHDAKALIQSDNMVLTASCGSNDWTWGIDYAHSSNTGDAGSVWTADVFGTDGTSTSVPPSLVSSSSLVWNLNNSAWDVTQGGSRSNNSDWKSPDFNTINTPLDDGWPTSYSSGNAWPGLGLSTDIYWEWTMVYEMSFDIADCGSDPMDLEIVSAHNSPPKEGDPDVPVTLFDYGDAPEGGGATFGTTNANTGAYHKILINGVFLGSRVDGETDGTPDGFAQGDDTAESDDEDGIDFQFDSADYPGLPAFIFGTNTYSITVSGPGYLNAWMDLDGNGSWDEVAERILLDEYFASAGTYVKSFNVPVGTPSGFKTFRFRYNSDDPAGTQLTTGPWDNGEVEDYVAVLGGTLDNDEPGIIPARAELKSVYPNPFNPATTIDYSIVTAGAVSLQVFDMNGREVETLVDAFQNPGYRSVHWNAGGMPSGIYFVRLTANGNSQTQKLMLLK